MYKDETKEMQSLLQMLKLKMDSEIEEDEEQVEQALENLMDLADTIDNAQGMKNARPLLHGKDRLRQVPSLWISCVDNSTMYMYSLDAFTTQYHLATVCL